LRKQWRFPSGATLQFGYLDNDNDRFRYQGSELAFIGVDELTQMTEVQYTYLLSRLRRHASSEVPLRMRATSNPGGIGHEWVKRRFIDEPGKDRLFIPAKLDDNPHIDRDEYRKALANLDSTTRMQLLEGIWVQDTTGLVYKYDDTRNGIDAVPDFDGMEYVMGIDLGASQSTPSTAFCIVAFHRHHPEAMWICHSECHAGMIPSTIAKRIHELNEQYDFSYIVADAGALGRGYIEEFRSRYGLPVRDARKQDKLGYRKIMNGDFVRGVLRVVRRNNEELIKEYQTLIWDDKGLDNNKAQANHLSDSSLYAMREAKHWLAVEPEKAPLPGTAERAKYEEKQILKHLIQASKQAQSKKGRRHPFEY
jgi:hypothetical protein